MERCGKPKLPHSVLQDFYEGTQRHRLAELAEQVYTVSQSDLVRREHQHTYLPPAKGALHWFLRYLINMQRNAHLPRILAWQLVNENIPITQQYRGSVIAQLAQQGLATQARTLWERYAVGKERDVVVGNTSAMLRLVSLFVSLSRRSDYTTEAGEREQHAGFAGQRAGATKNTPGEFLAFAERVFNAFRRSRAPLAGAHHWELNALARASFMLGRLEDGIAAFKLMFRMRYVPDLQDINVAIGVLAEHNPTAAADIIEHMVKMGIEPDAVSFGSIIHHAVIHGDIPLTTALIRRARELGITELSYKTVGTLLRAAATAPDEDGRLSPRTQLLNMTELVDSLLLARRVPSPNMGRDCVRVALRADDPSAAFRFWQLLMKDKTEWGDVGQTTTRQMIARCVRTHYNEGRLDEREARTMLHELRARFYPTRDTGASPPSRRERRELDD
ncbi:hypothetical protein FOMPIDRAFT_1126436 [Fomitopsis schrenkii]|uniref:Pentacotripeptide-repeat region of PRORP domain-containing protein n=1 Tax=Fomitopsis schrenkii TaxID=2126942 RepID=S8E0Y8_FOMSC|nr:hypothetical protein FOMPIDRAFT_1126436 [Fomitopsis schrenkii]